MSLFDYSHIVKEHPVDAYIELRCNKCKQLYYTRNMYYIGYASIFVKDITKEPCNHSLYSLKPTGRRVYPYGEQT